MTTFSNYRSEGGSEHAFLGATVDEASRRHALGLKRVSSARLQIVGRAQGFRTRRDRGDGWGILRTGHFANPGSTDDRHPRGVHKYQANTYACRKNKVTRRRQESLHESRSMEGRTHRLLRRTSNDARECRNTLRVLVELPVECGRGLPRCKKSETRENY